MEERSSPRRGAHRHRDHLRIYMEHPHLELYQVKTHSILSQIRLISATFCFFPSGGQSQEVGEIHTCQNQTHHENLLSRRDQRQRCPAMLENPHSESVAKAQGSCAAARDQRDSILPARSPKKTKSLKRRRQVGEWSHVQGTRWKRGPTDGKDVLLRLACVPNSDAFGENDSSLKKKKKHEES